MRGMRFSRAERFEKAMERERERYIYIYNDICIYLDMLIYDACVFVCAFACACWGPIIRQNSKTSWLPHILPATGEEFVRIIMSHKHLKVNSRSFGTAW